MFATNKFKARIVESVYGIPKDQVVGSSVETEFDYSNRNPLIKRLSKLELNDDKEGKPIGINRYIGRKPIFAAGNSDDDLEMLHWTDANTLKTFKLYVHHTDSVREWAYGRTSHIGKFDKGLEEATEKRLDNCRHEKRLESYPFERKE